MDEMMRGQRGWRELAVLGDKINKFTGMIEGLIWSPRGSDSNVQVDEWAFEEVGVKPNKTIELIVLVYHQH
jgi:protein phosphatase 1G